MTPEQTQEIIQWRERRLSPKEIARQMGLRPAEVSAFLREYSETHHPDKLLPPLVGCFINSGAAQQLLQPRQKSLIAWKRPQKLESDSSGLGEVVVTRMDKGRYIVSSFLIDYWCLGVKDAMFKRCDRFQYDFLLGKVQQMFGEDLQEISLEQAQAVVFGAIDYAASLGFQPHSDFEKAKANLGPRLDNLQEIQFGRDGKPFYFCGPYDDQAKILRTLRENVGEGNYEFVAGGHSEFGLLGGLLE